MLLLELGRLCTSLSATSSIMPADGFLHWCRCYGRIIYIHYIRHGRATDPCPFFPQLLPIIADRELALPADPGLAVRVAGKRRNALYSTYTPFPVLVRVESGMLLSPNRRRKYSGCGARIPRSSPTYGVFLPSFEASARIGRGGSDILTSSWSGHTYTAAHFITGR